MITPKSGSWIDYWKSETLFGEFQWQENMDIFVRTSRPIMDYGPADVVLDVGCGPGYLEAALKDSVRELHGVDVSERYLQRCRERFSGQPNVFFYKLDETNYTDLTPVAGKRFSKIVCLSVVQYYKSIDEVETLIRNVREVALPGARFLIADITIHGGWLKDTWGVLKTAYEERCFWKTLFFLVRARTSDYYRVRATQGLLSFTMPQLSDMISRLGLNAEILSTRLTTNSNRKHLLVRF
jgi:ubiquinone/menaquinone biosynthesis C-methylase UbiE